MNEFGCSGVMESAGDVFARFVPSAVRGALDGARTPLISSDLLAAQAGWLSGPVLQLSWPGVAAMEGALRAARQSDAILVVDVPRSVRQQQRGEAAAIARAILTAAKATRHDRPLVLLSSGWLVPPAEEYGAEDFRVEEAQQGIQSEVQSGYTAIGVRIGSAEGAPPHRVAQFLQPLVELGIGLEASFESAEGAPGFLTALLGQGIPIAGTAGGRSLFAGTPGIPTVDPLTESVPAEGPLRLSMDGFVLLEMQRVLDASQRRRVRRSLRRFGAAPTLVALANACRQFSDERQDRIRALVYAGLLAAVERLGGAEVASDLRDALVQASEDDPGARAVDER